MSTTTFAAYNNQYDRYKRGKQKYYELGIETYIKTRGRIITADEAWPYFNNGDIPWKQRTFSDHYYHIRRRLEDEDTAVELEAKAETRIEEPPTDEECRAVLNAIKEVIGVLSTKKDATSLQMKHTLLTAACILDDNGNVQNRYVLKHLNPTMNPRLFQKVVSLKRHFNASESLLLHDEHAANKGGTRKQFSKAIEKSIIDFWIANSTEDPNTYRFRKLRDEKGELYKQCYHYLHQKFKDLYTQWIDHVKEHYQWDETKLPKFSKFMQLKPVYVYKVKGEDYSACQKCFNFEQMTKALLRKLSARGAHSIGSVSCPNYNWYTMGDKCDCDQCFQCDATLEALKSSPLRLLKYLFCKTEDRYPPIDCIHGDCPTNQCGIFKIVDLLNSSKINIKSSDIVVFREILKVTVPLPIPKKGKYEKKVHANVRQEYLWNDFRKLYIDNLHDFFVHYDTYIKQHQTRRDFVDFTIGRVPHDAIYCHVDFIHKIPVEYSTMSNGMWADGEKVAYMVAYDRFQCGDSPGGLTQESTHYFCDDKSHGWSAAVTYIRKHIEFRIKYLKEHYDKTLEHFIFWSDNGEFKCGAFLAKISELAEELNIVITWNFTAAGHSKGKHDGEGHVVKTECRSAIHSDLIVFDKDKEPYSITLENYMEKFFGDSSKDFKFKRHFVSVPASEIKHYTAPTILEKRLEHIMDYHCFIMMNSQGVMHREHSCVCHRCISGLGYSACTRSSVCGSWTNHRWCRVGATNTSSNISSSSRSSHVSYGSSWGNMVVPPPLLPPPLLQERGHVGGRNMVGNSGSNQYQSVRNSSVSNQNNTQQQAAISNVHSGSIAASEYRYNPLSDWNSRR